MPDDTKEPESVGKLAIALQGVPFTVVVDRPEAARFWKKASSGRWEADTFAFIRKHAGPDLVFLDIGGWIGPMSLYASRFAGRVLSLEPDPVAYRDLTENVRLNSDNVDIWHVGVDNSEGELTLYAPSGLGQSITSSLRVEGAHEIRVPTVTFDQISKRLGDASRIIVKIDVEGHEYQLIDNLIAFAKRHHAPMHLSVHPRTFYDNVRRSMSRFAARRKAWRETRVLVEKLRSLGTLTLSDTGKPMTAATLFQYIFPRTRVHNFTLEIDSGV